MSIKSFLGLWRDRSGEALHPCGGDEHTGHAALCETCGQDVGPPIVLRAREWQRVKDQAGSALFSVNLLGVTIVVALMVIVVMLKTGLLD